jgi:hypothetical protein
MTDILNQFKTLENSISISSFSNKKRVIFSLIGALLFFPLFKPMYMYKKELSKDRVEKGGRMVTIYTEKYKISIKKVLILYLIYVAIVYTVMRFILHM